MTRRVRYDRSDSPIATKTTKATTAPTATEAERLRVEAERVANPSPSRIPEPLDPAMRTGMIAGIARIDGDDPASLTNRADVFIAGVYLGALRREARAAEYAARAPVAVAPRADETRDPRVDEKASARSMVDRISDPVRAGLVAEADAIASAVVVAMRGRADGKRTAREIERASQASMASRVTDPVGAAEAERIQRIADAITRRLKEHV